MHIFRTFQTNRTKYCEKNNVLPFESTGCIQLQRNLDFTEQNYQKYTQLLQAAGISWNMTLMNDSNILFPVQKAEIVSQMMNEIIRNG